MRDDVVGTPGKEEEDDEVHAARDGEDLALEGGRVRIDVGDVDVLFV